MNPIHASCQNWKKYEKSEAKIIGTEQHQQTLIISHLPYTRGVMSNENLTKQILVINSKFGHFKVFRKNLTTLGFNRLRFGWWPFCILFSSFKNLFYFIHLVVGFQACVSQYHNHYNLWHLSYKKLAHLVLDERLVLIYRDMP